MIAYHGGPFSDAMIATEVWRKHHAMVSFSRPEQIYIAAEHASTFALGNGAFSLWKVGQVRPDWTSYYRWMETWRSHPGFDFALIPDVIDGSESENDELLAEWPFLDGVPVYHLHEPFDRLLRLANSYSRVALGSSGPYASTCTLRWWDRMHEILNLLCDETGRPFVKLHGLRMLAPAILEHVPCHRPIRPWSRETSIGTASGTGRSPRDGEQLAAHVGVWSFRRDLAPGVRQPYLRAHPAGCRETSHDLSRRDHRRHRLGPHVEVGGRGRDRKSPRLLTLSGLSGLDRVHAAGVSAEVPVLRRSREGGQDRAGNLHSRDLARRSVSEAPALAGQRFLRRAWLEGSNSGNPGRRIQGLLQPGNQRAAAQ